MNQPADCELCRQCSPQIGTLCKRCVGKLPRLIREAERRAAGHAETARWTSKAKQANHFEHLAEVEQAEADRLRAIAARQSQTEETPA